MADDPTAREIAFRLIAALRADPDLYRQECARRALSPAAAGRVINDLVHIAGMAIRFATESRDELPGVSAEELMAIIERALDAAEAASFGPGASPDSA
jgi:hypothetical protein